jgi:hypothetical protein
MRTFARLGAGDVETTIANVVAGMTGRDEAAIRHHLDEMKDLGVKMPESFPFFFRVQAEHIQVLGTDGSGEVERVDDELWLTVGSDHADRKVEAYSVNVSKRLHPIGRHLWPIAEVSAHWDRLIARSRTTRGGERERYQERPLALMLHPDDLIHSATLWTADGSALGPSCFAGRSAQRPPCTCRTFRDGV